MSGVLVIIKKTKQKQKRRSIFNWCRKLHADMILLQETHSTIQTENQWKHEWGGNIVFCLFVCLFVCFSHGTSNGEGVAVIFRNRCNIDVYAPNSDSDQVDFYTKILDLYNNNSFDVNQRVIMGGDFNCVINAKLDKRGGKDIDKLKVVDKISDVMDSIDLIIDVWKFRHPYAIRFTWRQPNSLIQCRLDHF